MNMPLARFGCKKRCDLGQDCRNATVYLAGRKKNAPWLSTRRRTLACEVAIDSLAAAAAIAVASAAACTAISVALPVNTGFDGSKRIHVDSVWCLIRCFAVSTHQVEGKTLKCQRGSSVDSKSTHEPVSKLRSTSPHSCDTSDGTLGVSSSSRKCSGSCVLS